MPFITYITCSILYVYTVPFILLNPFVARVFLICVLPNSLHTSNSVPNVKWHFCKLLHLSWHVIQPNHIWWQCMPYRNNTYATLYSRYKRILLLYCCYIECHRARMSIFYAYFGHPMCIRKCLFDFRFGEFIVCVWMCGMYEQQYIFTVYFANAHITINRN